MNQQPSQAHLDRLLPKMGHGSHGLFFISRELNCSVALAEKVAKLGVQKRLLVPVHSGDFTKYKTQYKGWAAKDVEDLIRAARQDEIEMASQSLVAEDEEI